MNREIKFRAINAKGKVIYKLPYTDGVNDTIYFEEFNNRLCWRNEEGAHCNQPYKNGTLMQYTGFIDKTGREIYEGDIVQTIAKDDYPEDTYIADVIWGYDTAFVLRRDTSYNHGLPITWGGWESLEVIGNIYENPELLGDKQNETV